MRKINKKGFTLVELLAVIVVLALLMVVAGSSIGTALDNSKKSALKTEAKKILTHVKQEIEVAKMLYPNDITQGITSINVGYTEIKNDIYCFGLEKDKTANNTTCLNGNDNETTMIYYGVNVLSTSATGWYDEENKNYYIKNLPSNNSILYDYEDKNTTKKIKKEIYGIYVLEGKDGDYEYNIILDNQYNVIAFFMNYKTELSIVGIDAKGLNYNEMTDFIIRKKTLSMEPYKITDDFQKEYNTYCDKTLSNPKTCLYE